MSRSDINSLSKSRFFCWFASRRFYSVFVLGVSSLTRLRIGSSSSSSCRADVSEKANCCETMFFGAKANTYRTGVVFAISNDSNVQSEILYRIWFARFFLVGKISGRVYVGVLLRKKFKLELLVWSNRIALRWPSTKTKFHSINVNKTLTVVKTVSRLRTAWISSVWSELRWGSKVTFELEFDFGKFELFCFKKSSLESLLVRL